MIILLDSSTPTCRLTLIDEAGRHQAQWEAGRELAVGLLSFIESELVRYDKALADISGIGVYKGPGSFTGLRIGVTVLNTLADSLGVAIVGETGEDWQSRALSRLESKENDRVVLPLYGGSANITRPRK